MNTACYQISAVARNLKTRTIRLQKRIEIDRELKTQLGERRGNSKPVITNRDHFFVPKSQPTNESKAVRRKIKLRNGLH